MKKLTGILLATALTTGCAIDPYTGEEKVSNTAWGTGIGAGAGAATGAAIGAIAGGGKGAALGAAIGAGVGAAGGAGVGYYMDTQEKKLRLRLESTGVRVQRTGDNYSLSCPAISLLQPTQIDSIAILSPYSIQLPSFLKNSKIPI